MNGGDEFRVEVVCSLEVLERYRNDFHSLLTRVGVSQAGIFHLDYINALYPLYMKGKKMCFVLLWDRHLLAGVAPLVIVQRNWKKLFYRQLQFFGAIPHGLGITTPGFIIDQAFGEKKALLIMLNALNTRQRIRWDKFYIAGMRSGLQLKYLEQYFRHFSSESIASGYSVNFEDGFDGYFIRQFPTRMQKKLIKLKNRLSIEQGGVEFSCAHTIDSALFEEMGRLHSTRQQVKRGKGNYQYKSIFDDAFNRRSLKEFIETAEKLNQLRIYLLRVNHQLISFRMATLVGERELCWLSAFAEDYKQYSPTKLLTLEMLALNKSEIGSRYVDFQANQTGLKKEFCNTEYERYAVDILNMSNVLSRAKNTVSRLRNVIRL